MTFFKLTVLAIATTMLAASGCGNSSKTVSTTISGSTAATTNAAETTSEAKAPVTTPAPSAPVKVATVQVATGTPLAKAQWIAAGDAICAHLQTELAANPVKGTKTFAVVFPQAAALERVEVSELGKLVPPRSNTKDWQTLLTKSLESAENTATLGRAAQTREIKLDDPLIVTTTKIDGEIHVIAKRDGFKHCG